MGEQFDNCALVWQGPEGGRSYLIIVLVWQARGPEGEVLPGRLPLCTSPPGEGG